jgi:acylphosphatase
MNARYHILISGDVHGVFFRAFVQEHAEELGLKGWVKNRRNKEIKQVEVIVEGNEDRIKELIKYCRQGPPSSTVEKIETKKQEYTGEFATFSFEYL